MPPKRYRLYAEDTAKFANSNRWKTFTLPRNILNCASKQVLLRFSFASFLPFLALPCRSLWHNLILQDLEPNKSVKTMLQGSLHLHSLIPQHRQLLSVELS